MISRGYNLLRAENFNTSFIQAVKCLGAGYFMNKMLIDV